MVDGGNHSHRQHQPHRRDWRECRREGPVVDSRKAADHHVLWIARNGGHTPDVGRHRHRQQVRHRVAAQLAGDFEHQGREHQAHGVVHEESGEESGYENDGGQQDQGPVRMFHHPLRHRAEKTG